MLHILLLILKVIGITLAVIIGVLLSAICLILFVPVRYRIEADGKLGREEPLHVKIKVTWLLHIVSIFFYYPGAAYVRARIFFFTIFDSSKPKAERVKEEKNKNKKTAKAMIKEAEEKENKENEKNPEYEDKRAIVTGEDKESAERKECTPSSEILPTEGANEVSETLEVQEKKNAWKKLWDSICAFFSAIKSFFMKFLEIIRNIEYTIITICDKIKKVAGNIEYYIEVLQGEVFKKAFGVSKRQLFRIIKSIRPRKCDIRLTVGTGDPASTGQILAIYGMLYPFIGNNVIIQADFENMTVEGSVFVKGRVTAFTFLVTAFQLYRNKNLRQLIKLLKREES